MGNGNYNALFKGLILPPFRRVHLQRLVDAIVIVVLEVLPQNPTEMPFTEDDDPVQTLSTDAAVESLRIWILPWAMRRGQHFLDSHILGALPIYTVSISKLIPRCCVPWVGLDNFLRTPSLWPGTSFSFLSKPYLLVRLPILFIAQSSCLDGLARVCFNTAVLLQVGHSL